MDRIYCIPFLKRAILLCNGIYTFLKISINYYLISFHRSSFFSMKLKGSSLKSLCRLAVGPFIGFRSNEISDVFSRTAMKKPPVSWRWGRMRILKESLIKNSVIKNENIFSSLIIYRSLIKFECSKRRRNLSNPGNLTYNADSCPQPLPWLAGSTICRSLFAISQERPSASRTHSCPCHTPENWDFSFRFRQKSPTFQLLTPRLALRSGKMGCASTSLSVPFASLINWATTASSSTGFIEQVE